MLHTIEIGKKIGLYRKSLKISQTNFAKLLGVSNQAVSKWENGNSLPDLTNLVLISEIFNIKLDDLLDYPCSFDSLQKKLFTDNLHNVKVINNVIQSNPYQTFKYANKTLYLKRKQKDLEIKNTTLQKMIYSGCEFENIKIINCKNIWSVYINNVYTNVTFYNSNIEHCQSKLNIWTGRVEKVILKYNVYVHDLFKDLLILNCVLSFSSYTNTTFVNVQFINSSWHKGIFHNLVFRQCCFKNFKSTECCFQRCTYIDCVFDKKAYDLFNVKNNKIIRHTIIN